jgi:hypothetical protein
LKSLDFPMLQPSYTEGISCEGANKEIEAVITILWILAVTLNSVNYVYRN